MSNNTPTSSNINRRAHNGVMQPSIVTQEKNNIISGNLESIVDEIITNTCSIDDIKTVIKGLTSDINEGIIYNLDTSSSLMTFISGGKPADKKDYSSMKTDIQNFANLWKKSLQISSSDLYLEAISKLANNEIIVSLANDNINPINDGNILNGNIKISGDAKLSINLSINNNKINIKDIDKELDKLIKGKNGGIIGKINKIYENTKNIKNIDLTNISNLFNGFNSLGSMDQKGIKQLNKNLDQLSRNVEKKTFKNIGAINSFVNMLSNLGDTTTMSPTKIAKSQLAFRALLNIYDPEGALGEIIGNVNKLGPRIAQRTKENYINSISEFIKSASNISDSIEYKKILKSQSVILGLLVVSKLSSQLVDSWKELDIKSLNATVKSGGRIDLIKSMIYGISTINKVDIKSYNDNIILLSKGILFATIVGSIADKGIDGINKIAKFSKSLELVVDAFLKPGDDGTSLALKLMDPQFSDLSETIDNIATMFEDLSKVCVYAAVCGVFGKLGVKGVDDTTTMMSSIKELINDFNDDIFNMSDNDINKKIESVVKIVKGLSIISLIASVIVPVLPFSVVGLLGLRYSANIIKGVVSKFDEIEVSEDIDKKMKKVALVIAIASGILIFGGLVGTVVLRMIPQILGFTLLLSTFIFSVVGAFNLASKGMSDTIKYAKEFAMLILVSGAILTYGGLIAKFVSLVDLLTFVASLSLLIFGVTYAYMNNASETKKSLEVSESFMKLIVVAGATLALGSLIASIAGPGTMFMFGLTLTIFIGAVVGVFSVAAKYIPGALDAAQEFGMLIGISSLSLLIGATMVIKHPWISVGALGFGVLLGVFVLLVRAAYSFGDILGNIAGGFIGSKVGEINGDLNSDIANAKQFAILVAISATTMLIGGGIVMKFPWIILTSMGFALTLSVFLIGIAAAYKVASMLIRGTKGMSIAYEFSILVAISATTLLIGGAIMMIPGMASSVITFATTLGLFVLGVSLAYGIAGKLIGNGGVMIGYQMATLVAVSALTLLISGYVMMNNPGIEEYIWSFIKADLVLIGGMALILGLLGKFGKNLGMGTLALLGISVAIGITAYVFDMIVDIVNKLDGKFGQLWGVIGSMFGVLALFAGSIFGLGVLMGTGALAFGLGLAALAAIDGAIWTTCKVMLELINLIKISATLNNTTINMDVMLGNISNVIKMVDALSPLASVKTIAKMWLVKKSITSLGVVMSTISKAIQDYANLRVPIYDENGKESGYRNISDSDFESAANNIEKIITVIGGAIITTYDKNPQMFSAGIIGDLIGTDTPFTRVVTSCSSMGMMISKIAEGVKEMAELKVPIYKGLDKVGYRSLNDNDFKLASDNIELIVRTLGDAVLRTYENAPEGMFDSGNFGNLIGQKTPFGRVVTSVTGLGKMISSIAKGVKDMAELRIPTYDDAGKQIGNRPLTPADFIMAAANTQLIVACLGNAIMDLGRDPNTSWMFEDKSLFIKDGSGSRFSQIVTSLKGIGGLISETAKAVKDTAELRIPNYDNNGKQIGTRRLTPFDFTVAGVNTEMIMSVMPQAIMKLYEDHNDWFEDSSWFSNDASTSPFAKVKNCLGGLGKLVDEAVKSIKSVQDLKYDQKTLGWISGKIRIIMQSIPLAIQKATMDKDGDLLDMFDDEAIYKDKIGPAYSKYTSLLNGAIDSYNKINELINNFSDKTNIHQLNKIVDTVITQIPFSIKRGIDKMSGIDLKTEEALGTRFGYYKTTLSTAIEVYKEINKFREDILNNQIKEIEENPIVGLNVLQTAMLSGITEALNKFDIKMISNIQAFAATMNIYKIGMQSLFDVYNSAPEDQSKYVWTADAIKKVNLEIANTKNSLEFRNETKDISKFTKSINDLDVSKLSQFTSLVVALDKMAQRLGGLDKLTNTLANQLAVVLDKLVKELNESAKTIKVADEMQKKRHATIKESIKTIGDMLNRPVEVKVAQVDAKDLVNDQGGYDNGGTPANDSDPDTTPSGSTNS